MIKMLGENLMEGAWFWIAPIARGWETTTAVGYRGYNIIGLALIALANSFF